MHHFTNLVDLYPISSKLEYVICQMQVGARVGDTGVKCYVIAICLRQRVFDFQEDTAWLGQASSFGIAEGRMNLWLALPIDVLVDLAVAVVVAEEEVLQSVKVAAAVAQLHAIARHFASNCPCPCRLRLEVPVEWMPQHHCSVRSVV